MVLLDMRGIADLSFIFLDFFHAVVNLGNIKKDYKMYLDVTSLSN